MTTKPADTGRSVYDGFISYSHAADDLLAPRLQSGLQRFAKPWWKRRALRVFRDESSLSANPHLWESITEALDTSGWFVLLLSPDAARSEWVNQEIAYWVKHKDASRILPVVTAGEFGWSDGDVSGDAVPDALRGVFASEPRWVDLRFAKGEEQLDLQDPRFADAIAGVASAMRGVPKDELAGEEVRQHRRTVRTAWAAGVMLVALLVTSAFAGLVASRNAEEASRQAELAETNAAEALRNAEAEAEARVKADSSAALAEEQARIARARELSAAAGEIREEDPELAMLLGLAALNEAPEEDLPIEVGASFRRSLYSLNAVSRVPVPGGEQLAGSTISPDGTRLAILSYESLTVRMLDTATWEELWVYGDGSPDFGDQVHFSADGSQVVLSVADSSISGFDAPFRDGEDDGRWARLVFLDAESGTEEVVFEFEGDCPGVLIGPQSPDGRWWPVISSDSPLCDEFGEWTLWAYEADTFSPVIELGSATPGNMSWSLDSARLAFNSYWGLGVQVYEFPGGEKVFDEMGERFYGDLAGNGQWFAAGAGSGDIVSVIDLESGLEVDRMEGLSDWPQAIEFSDDGSLLFAGSRGEGAVVWSMRSGRVLQRLGGISSVWGIHHLADRQLVHVVGSEEIVTYDLSGDLAGEFGTVRSGAGLQANGLAVTGDVGSALIFEEDTFGWQVAAFDATTGELSGAVADVELGRTAEVLPDGRIVVFRRSGLGEEALIGPVSVWDPVADTYEYLTGCQVRWSDVEFTENGTAAECSEPDREWFEASRLHLLEPTNTLLVSDYVGRVLFYDATSLELLDEVTIPMDARGGIEEYGGGWVAVSSGSLAQAGNELAIISVSDGETIAVLPGGISALSPDGSRLSVGDGRGGYTLYDTATWEAVSEGRVGDARVRGMAFSPSGDLLATGGTDDVLRIWDAEAGVEVDRIPLPFPNDAHWLDESRLLVSFTDKFTVVELDLRAVADLALERLTRGFSVDECAAYRVDPCPTLEEMRDR